MKSYYPADDEDELEPQSAFEQPPRTALSRKQDQRVTYHSVRKSQPAFDVLRAKIERDDSGDSFERKVLEMDSNIRRRNNAVRDDDIGLTNYSELNITMRARPPPTTRQEDSYSADLLAQMQQASSLDASGRKSEASEG